MKRQELSPELCVALRRLRLGQLIATLPERIVLADKQEMSFEQVLLMVLTDEIQRRDSAAVVRRAEQAGLDPEMRLERWDKTAKITYDKELFRGLCSLRFVEEKRHVTMLGPVGVGKTFLANVLGHLACQKGYEVKLVRADRMLHTLRKSRFDGSHEAELRKLQVVDLLIVDDFGMEEMKEDESRDIYEVMVERTGRRSMVMTSNRDTSEWVGKFDETLRAQSALDRYVNNSYDLVIEGESYRPRLKPRKSEEGEKK